MVEDNEKRPEELAKDLDDFDATEIDDKDLEGVSGGAAVKARTTEPEKSVGTKKEAKALKLRLHEGKKGPTMFFAG
jgi:16S rRNA U516 pseudouridylate synthase RsuA-like enzyme